MNANGLTRRQAELQGELQALRARMTEIESEIARLGGPEADAGAGREPEFHVSHALLRAMVDNLPFSFWAMDARCRYILQNTENRRHWGDLIGKRLDRVPLSPEMRALWEEQDRRALEGEVVEEEYTFTRDGEEVLARKTIAPIYVERKVVGIVCVSFDITERRRLEKELLEVSAREQRRIARDLHDGLGQELTGIFYLCRGLAKDLATEGSTRAADATDVAEMVKHALAMTRSLARGLQPVELDAEGLVSALHHLASTASKVYEVACRVACDKSAVIRDNAVAEHLYRIAQEAVNNAITHGRAGEIVIALGGERGKGILEVRDNGSGFPADVDWDKGMGLRIMGHRAGMIGGVLDVRAQPGGGTVLTCSFNMA
jgi:PAS domain S-box-containing protein